MTRQQKFASFGLSFMMATVARMRSHEKKDSALFKRLQTLEDHLGRTLDAYKIGKFTTDDFDHATTIFTTLETEVNALYGKE